MSVCGRTTEMIILWERLPTKIEEAPWTTWCFCSSWSKEIFRMLNSITSSLRFKSRWMKSQLKLNHCPQDGLISFDYLKSIYSSILLSKLIVIALALQVLVMTKVNVISASVFARKIHSHAIIIYISRSRPTSVNSGLSCECTSNLHRLALA